MNQILLGVSIPFVISAVIYFARKRRASFLMLIFTPLFMGLCAIWAIVPDIPRVIGLQDLYHKLADNPKCDIFFWHYSIDKFEADSKYYMLVVILIILTILYVGWRELKIQEES